MHGHAYFAQAASHDRVRETQTYMKNITIRQLKTFESVARNLSFSRAAEDLHLTQPAVSMQIKQMEDQAGLALFLQTGKRISLTEAGQLMLRHSRVILADLRAAEQSFASLKTVGTQRLRIGVITSGSYFFPHLISAFIQGELGLDLDLTVRSRDQLITLLRSDQIDLAIMVHAPTESNMVAEAFAPNPFVMVAAPTHPLASERDISYARIAEERLLVRESGTDTRSVADEVFCHPQSSPHLMEIGSAEAIKQSVMAGMGITFLPTQAVASEVRAGLLTVLDAQGFPLDRRWHVVHRADRNLPSVALEFRQFLLVEGSARLNQLEGSGSHKAPQVTQRINGTAVETQTNTATSALQEVARRTRALLRDGRLHDTTAMQSDALADTGSAHLEEGLERVTSRHH